MVAGKEIAMKLRRMMWLSLILLIAFVMLAPALSSAQEATGRIFGTVYDPQGLVISDAQIAVTNTATQVVRKATTNKEGSFQI